MNKNFKKTILITGSSGFLGSNIVDALHNGGHNVVLFDKNPSPYKQNSYKEIVGDI